jgi:hypothetical protein
MIVYNKKSARKRAINKTYRFMKVGVQDTGRGENFLPFNRPHLAVNLCAKDGEIVNTPGFCAYNQVFSAPEVPPFASTLTRVFKHTVRSTETSSTNYLIVCDLAQRVFTMVPGSMAEIKEVGSTKAEVIDATDFCQQGKDVAVLSTYLGLEMLVDGQLQVIEGAPGATSICTHKGRMFAVRRTPASRVWFSDVMDVTNWNVSLTEGGYIDLDADVGNILKLISLGEYLYVFCENSVWKISAYGDQRSFVVVKVLETAGRIAYGSVVLGGGYVYYMTDAGFFRFDGYNAKRILTELDGIVPYVASVRDNTFCKSEVIWAVEVKDGPMTSHEIGRVMLIRLDVFSGEFSLSQGYLINSMVGFKHSGKTQLFTTQGAVNGNGAHKLIGVQCDEGTNFGQPVKKVYSTGMSDLGMSERKKHLKRMTFCTETPLDVLVRTDKGDFDYFVPECIACCVRPKVSFNRISLEIKTTEPVVRIVNPTVNIDFFE